LKVGKKFNLGSLFGDTDLSNMMSRVDTLIGGIKTQPSSEVEVDLTDIALNEFIQSMDHNDKDKTSDGPDAGYQNLLDQITVAANRLSRYKIYEELYNSVQLIKRIVQTYINNSLQQDVLTGKYLYSKITDSGKGNSQDFNYFKTYQNDVIDKFNLEANLKNSIIQNVIRKGDYFIEIVDLQDDIVTLPKINKSTATEDRLVIESLSSIERKINLNKTNVDEYEKILNGGVDQLYSMLIEVDDNLTITNSPELQGIRDAYINETSKYEGVETETTSKAFNKKLLDRIYLKYHKPDNISVLLTDDNTELGYVEIMEHSKVTNTSSIGNQFAQVVGQLTNLSSKKQDNSIIIQKLVNRMIKDIIKKSKITVSANDDNLSPEQKQSKEIQYERLLHDTLGDDLFFLTKKLFIQSNPNYKTKANSKLNKLSVRFISKSRMIQIRHNPVDFFPYGSSIIDPLVYPGKLYLLSQLANVVTKLSRASVVRKWTVSNLAASYSNVC